MVIIIVVGSLIIVGLTGFIIYLLTYFKERKFDDHFVFSFMPHRHNYRAFGSLIDIKYGPEGRKSFKVTPKDISYKTINEKEPIEPVEIYTDRNHELTLAKGKHSKDLNITLIFPADASEFSEEFRNTEFGKWLLFYTELKNSDNTAIEALKKGMSWQSAHIKDMGWGEASVERLKYMEELFKDALDALKETKKDKTTTISSFNQPQ